MRSEEVLAALRKRHPEVEGEWATFREAWRIDFYAIRCWQSGVGLRRIAYEVKCSRSDFLAELRKPAKRENALSLSHQFFFATPRGLVRPDEVPVEAGLVYVSDGVARLAKKAPIRQPRPFKLSEAIYLLRLPGFRSGTLELRREVIGEQRTSEYYRDRMQQQQRTLESAQARLLELGGHLIVKGSTWRGRWQPHSWTAAEEDVWAYVEEVKDRHVTLRRVDNGEIARYVSMADLLTDFELLDMRAVA